MSSIEWYVIHIASNQIVNCVTTNERDPIKLLEALQLSFDEYRLASNPPLSMLEKYRYWNERP